ncbi:26S proteasome regulatory subunit 10B-like [Saccoglossus kowalevskii]
MAADPREKAIQEYRKKLLEHKELDARLKEMREQLKEFTKDYDKSENDLKALQSVGQLWNYFAAFKHEIENKVFHFSNTLNYDEKIPLPNEQARMDILKIHAGPITKHGDIDFEAVVKLSDGFNGADLRNVCTEAGMHAIRAEREYVIEEDFMKAVRKVSDNKKLESKLDYKPV